MSIFNEANMVARIRELLPEGQHFKAGIHAVVKKAKLYRFFANAFYDSSSHLVRPSSDVPLLCIIKSKEDTFDVYMGVSEDCMVIIPCGREMWGYEHAEVTDRELVATLAPAAGHVDFPISPSDILPVYRISQINECKVRKNWLGAYVCEITFVNSDFLKVLLPPLAGLFGGMPHHKSYRDEILKLLRGEE